MSAPRMEDAHGEWVLRIYDDQPIPEGKKYAPDNRVVLLRNAEQVREFLYPGYRIWTLLAHWTEGLADLEASTDEPCDPCAEGARCDNPECNERMCAEYGPEPRLCGTTCADCPCDCSGCMDVRADMAMELACQIERERAS